MENTILDAVVDTTLNTLEQYKVLMGQGRFTEALECLNMAERLTYQAHRIEDHVSPSFSRGAELNMAMEKVQEIRSEPC